MTGYLIIKSSRVYTGGVGGYMGPTWQSIGMDPQSFLDKDAALDAAALLSASNPVGFGVVEAFDIPDTGEVTYSVPSGMVTDYYKDRVKTRSIITYASGATSETLFDEHGRGLQILETNPFGTCVRSIDLTRMRA